MSVGMKLWYCSAFPVELIYFPRWENHRINCIHFDELLSSLETEGMINPLFGTTANGRYQVGPGKQRYCAARTLGWREVPILFWDRDNTLSKLKDVHKQEMTVEEANTLFDGNNFVVEVPRKGYAMKKHKPWRNEKHKWRKE